MGFMNILVLNAGSSSIKYQIFSYSQSLKSEKPVFSGRIEHLNESGPVVHRWLSEDTEEQNTLIESTQGKVDTAAIFEHVCKTIAGHVTIDAVGHRVVHGGDHFSKPTLINTKVLDTLRDMIPLAPLHNPSNISGIESAQHAYPDLPHIAIFDTAFHHQMPEEASRYALPPDIQRKHQVHRYGFHGIAHQYLAVEAARQLNRPISTLKLVTLHLGNGASAAAISGGTCIDTSMGMTPLEGLVMGSRCGDIDAGVLIKLLNDGYSVEELDNLLNHLSGLKGLCGDSDLRIIQKRISEGDTVAKKALNLYCYRIKKYIGAYIAALGGIDALVFSGGIGEHSALVRQMCCENMGHLGIVLDIEQNQTQNHLRIDAASAACAVMIIPANEELEIARQALGLLNKVAT
jgi:acetate kinase